MKGALYGTEVQLQAMVEQYPDATLLEYCKYWEKIIINGSVKVQRVGHCNNKKSQ
jgi:hypothetical protein